ncbi:MAG: SDR family oxidoreductase [Thermoleophilia bacterium]|nr:SDR family oxidoreductase [Thermoleophilia bacterium]
MRGESARHEGRGVVVTGGTSGIGLAAAHRFADEGARVWIAGTRREKLEEALAGLPADRVRGHPCDVSDEEQVEGMYEQALDFLGTLDAVFVNAGIDGKGDAAVDLPVEDFRRVLEVNLVGAFLSCRAAARRMDSGAMVVNGSASGLEAEANFADYNASKAGVIMLARTLAVELAPRGICVTAICPGYVRTPMNAEFLDVPENLEQVLAGIPVGRLGKPEEVAALVSFLAGPEAAYMAGAVVTIDGGRLA